MVSTIRFYHELKNGTEVTQTKTNHDELERQVIKVIIIVCVDQLNRGIKKNIKRTVEKTIKKTIKKTIEKTIKKTIKKTIEKTFQNNL